MRQTSLLLETVDIIAADAGSWGAVSSRLSMQQQRQSQQQGPSPGRWGLLPRLCALEDFKDLERRQMTKQLRADHSQSQKEQQKQGQAVFPGAETACVFISAFIEEATPYLISFVRLLPSLRRLTICSFFSVRPNTKYYILTSGPRRTTCSNIWPCEAPKYKCGLVVIKRLQGPLGAYA